MENKPRRALTAALVFAALAQTFCEDFALAMQFSWSVRRALAYAGFAFDLAFGAQFFLTLYRAALNRSAADFFVRGFGWLDCAASLPLVVLYSGPSILGLAAGGVPLVPWAEGAGRALCLLRFARLFRLVLAYSSPRLVKILSLGLICLVLAVSIFSGPGVLEKRLMDEYSLSAVRLASLLSGEGEGREHLVREIREYSRSVPELLLVRREASSLYSRYAQPYFAANYGPSDYIYFQEGELELFFSLKPILAANAGRAVSWMCVLAAFFTAFFMYTLRRKKSLKESVKKGIR